MCGRYQEDTTSIRKAGVVAKKAGMYAGKYAMKFGVKAAASAIGLDDYYTQRAAGMAADGISEAIGLNPDAVSVSDVTYKCSFCNHYWEGQDNPYSYNDIQKKTVETERQNKMISYNEKFKSSIKHTLIAFAFVALSFWIWSGRMATDVTHSFLGITSTSTNYSWHYYVFWPMVIVSGYFAIIYFFDTIAKYKEAKLLKDISLGDFAKMYMQLGSK